MRSRLCGQGLSLAAAVLALGLLVLPSAPRVASAGAPVTLPTLPRVTVLATPRAMKDFTLTDQNGNSRSFGSLRGAPLLVFFGFTNCPDVCPAALAKLRLLHDADGGALKSVRVILVSVDGERDSPAVMKKYLATLSPDFIGLTGSPRAVGDIAARFSAVAFKEQPGEDGNYKVFHSEQIFVVDKAGSLRASFSGAALDDMLTITRLLLAEPG